MSRLAWPGVPRTLTGHIIDAPITNGLYDSCPIYQIGNSQPDISKYTYNNYWAQEDANKIDWTLLGIGLLVLILCTDA